MAAVTTKVASAHVRKLWFALRLTDDTLALGIAVDMKRFWIVFRLGPVCFDVTWAETEPRWDYSD